MTTSGQRANKRGRHLEDFVADLLEEAGYEYIAPPWLIFAMRDMKQPVYAKQVEVGRDIYGKLRPDRPQAHHPAQDDLGGGDVVPRG